MKILFLSNRGHTGTLCGTPSGETVATCATRRLCMKSFSLLVSFMVYAAFRSYLQILCDPFLLRRLRREGQCMTTGVDIDGNSLAISDVALQHQPSKCRLDFFLNNTLQRTCAVVGIVAGSY